MQSTSPATCRTRCRPRWVREGGVRNPVGVGRSRRREEAACTEEADAAHGPPPAALPLATGPPPRERAKGSSNPGNFRSGPKEGGSGTGRCGSGDRRSWEPRRRRRIGGRPRREKGEEKGVIGWREEHWLRAAAGWLPAAGVAAGVGFGGVRWGARWVALEPLQGSDAREGVCH